MMQVETVDTFIKFMNNKNKNASKADQINEYINILQKEKRWMNRISEDTYRRCVAKEAKELKIWIAKHVEKVGEAEKTNL